MAPDAASTATRFHQGAASTASRRVPEWASHTSAVSEWRMWMQARPTRPAMIPVSAVAQAKWIVSASAGWWGRRGSGGGGVTGVGRPISLRHG